MGNENDEDGDEMECEHLRMRDDDVECPDCGAEVAASES